VRLQSELFRVASQGPWWSLQQLRPEFSNPETEPLYPTALQVLLVAASEASTNLNELRDVCPKLADASAKDACTTRLKNVEIGEKLQQLRAENIDWEVLQNYSALFQGTAYEGQYHELLQSKLNACEQFCTDPQKLQQVCAALDPGTAKAACVTNWCARAGLKARRDYEAGTFTFETGDMYTLACRATPDERDAEVLEWRFAARTAYLRWREGDLKSAEGRPHGYSKQAWVTLMEALKQSSSARFSEDFSQLAPDVFSSIGTSYREAEDTAKNATKNVFVQWSDASAHRPSPASDQQSRQNWLKWSSRLLDEAQYALTLDRDEHGLSDLIQQIQQARQELDGQPARDSSSSREIDWCSVAVDPAVAVLMNFVPYLPLRIPLAIGWSYIRHNNTCPI
jgi:hypothetical protein